MDTTLDLTRIDINNTRSSESFDGIARVSRDNCKILDDDIVVLI